MNVLVVGCGSIGKRHIGILSSMGINNIDICDKSKERIKETKEKFGIRNSFKDYKDAFGSNKYDATFICIPTSLHIPAAICAAENGSHIFLEKPISHNLNGVDDLIKLVQLKRLKLMVGYHLRFHPALKKIKKIIEEGIIGRVLSFRAECGQYLPDWHPWEDYSKFYMAIKELGGGAILDISHEIDYTNWFFGDIEEVAAIVDTISKLEISSDDIAEIILRYKNNIIGNIHLDLLQRVYQRNIKIIGDEGTLIWDYPDKIIKTFLVQKNTWESSSYEMDKDKIYKDEVKYFFECIEKDLKPPVDIISGKKTLEIVLAAIESSNTKRFISI